MAVTVKAKQRMGWLVGKDELCIVREVSECSLWVLEFVPDLLSCSFLEPGLEGL